MIDQQRKQRYAAQRHRHYLEHRQELLAKTSEYQRTHREVQRRANKKYEAKNRELIREKARRRGPAQKRRYYIAHREQILEKVKKYQQEHPEKTRIRVLASRHRRRAQAAKTVIDVKGISKWMRQIRSLPFVRCYWCGTKVSGSGVHFDHVIPLSREGTHTIGNLCTSCPECNLSKNAKLPDQWDKSSQIFLSL